MAIAALAPPAAGRRAAHVLEPAGRIGFGWQADLWKIGKYGWMSYVAFAPDGRSIASNGATAPDDVSGKISIWSFPGGRLLRRLPSRTGLSPDWLYYVTDREVRRAADGKTVIAFAGGERALTFTTGRALAFTADGLLAVSAESRPGASITIFNLATGRALHSFGDHGALALAASRSTLAAGHWDIVTLWNLRTGRRLAVLRGMGRYVSALAFSRDGRLLAAADDLGKVQLWDVRRRSRLWSLQLPGGDVSEPAFSPDGRFVAVGIYGTGSVWLVDLRTGRLVDHRQASGIGCGSVAFSPDSRYLIAPSTGGLITWPYDKGGTVRIFRILGRR
jgi:WD40 repeat protein